MATTVTTGLYEFDPTGTSSANLVSNERQSLQSPGRDDYYFIIPQAAPFFVKSLKVSNAITGVVYVEGQDYAVGHWFIEAMTQVGRPIAGSIRFLNREISGIIRLDYQTLGGQWGFNDQAILEELSNKLVNPLVRSWAQIEVLPAAFPPIPHDQSVDTLVGMDEVVGALDGISQALGSSASDAFNNHLLDKSNPHDTTKYHVQLGNVQNFPVADDQEAADGLRSDRYVTPRGIRAFFEAFGGGDFTAHLSDTNNPHGTTAADVDAYSITQVDAMLANYLSVTGTAADTSKAFGYEFNDLQIQLLQGTAADSNRLGGLLYDEIVTDIRNGTVYNSERFNGLTSPEWMAMVEDVAIDAATGRAGIQDHVFFLADAGYADYTKVLERVPLETDETGTPMEVPTAMYLLTHRNGAGDVVVHQVTLPFMFAAADVKVLNGASSDLEFTVTEGDNTRELWIKVNAGDLSFNLIALTGMDTDHVSFADTNALVTALTPTGTNPYPVTPTLVEAPLIDALTDEFTEATNALSA